MARVVQPQERRDHKRKEQRSDDGVRKDQPDWTTNQQRRDRREREIAGPRAIRRALLSRRRLPPPQVDPVVEEKRHAVKYAEHRRERRAPEPEQEHAASNRTNLCTN